VNKNAHLVEEPSHTCLYLIPKHGRWYLSYPNFWPKISHSYILWPRIISDFSLKYSAERYFKIPHFCSDVGPSSHLFISILMLSFIFHLLILFYFVFILFLIRFILFFISFLISVQKIKCPRSNFCFSQVCHQSCHFYMSTLPFEK